MHQLYPLQFKLDGMTQSYLWGGNKLESLVPSYAATKPLAEIWAVSDRPEDGRVSVVANGELAGMNLHELIECYGSELIGDAKMVNGKFPLLIKLIDAKTPLSLQVHPPAHVAGQLHGKSKIEAWLFLDNTASTASITAGLSAETSKEEFKAALASNTVESLLHSFPVQSGDCMFLPSGRLHAIGAGCLLLEIQENSNTTYRVFDWNRIDPATQQPRDLHVEEALASITFDDKKPSLQQPLSIQGGLGELLVDCPQFRLERWRTQDSNTHQPNRSFEIITCLTGMITLEYDDRKLALPPLNSSLVPASLHSYTVNGSGTYSRVFVPSAV